VGLVLASVLSALLALPACTVNVKKNAQGEDKKVDIETPVGGIHVNKNADIADVGLPVYPGARRKEKSENGEEKSANVNISAGKYGLRVVAIEYLSDDPPEKLIDYYKGQLKKFGNVLECHTSHHGSEVNAHYGKDNDTDALKCDDNGGKVVELKVGTKQNQHIVSIEPADSGKGTDFGLVYVQIRGRETV
jgi:hypothetical protein